MYKSNQKSDVDSVSTMDLQKGLVVTAKDFVRNNSENINNIFFFTGITKVGLLRMSTILREEIKRVRKSRCLSVEGTKDCWKKKEYKFG